MNQGISMINNFKVLTFLQQGGQANVYLCTFDSKFFVAKVFIDEGFSNNFERQVTISSQLNHKYFLPKFQSIPLASIIYQTNEQINRPVIIYPYLSKGDLFDYLSVDGGFSAKYCKNIFKKILEGILYLTDQGIAHRDLKPQNILFDSEYNPIIVDFGHSAKIQVEQNINQAVQKIGTDGFRPPQLQEGFYYQQKSQIFTLGVILFSIYAGFQPFTSTRNSNQHYKFIMRKNYQKFWMVQYQRKYKGFYSQQFKSLINQLLSYNHEQRLTLKALKQNKWLNQDVASDLQLKEQMDKRYKKIISANQEKKKILQIIQQDSKN